MTIDLIELRDAAQKAFPAQQLTPARDASWQIIIEMGWLMVDLPEDLSGLGLGPAATAAMQFELGRTLPSAPLAPAILGLQAIATSSRLVNKAEWIERICGGDYVPLNMLPARIEVGQDGSLTGRISGVFEADMAAHVLAHMPDGYRLIPLSASGVQVIERPLWDVSRRLFDIELHRFVPDPAMIVAEGTDAEALHERLSCAAQLAVAADSLGAAHAIFELTVDYLKVRKQFDRPLALFQALKHRVADLKVRLTAAEALLWSRAGPSASLIERGALRAHCTQVFVDVAEEAIQLHGGIGLTDEHPCHLFFKRAMLNHMLCGGTDHWEAEAGRQLLAN